MAGYLCICNWDRYQHYKDRSAPWVKLHRDMLTSESWLLGTDLSRVVQLASMMLAPRYDNQIPFVFELCKKAMGLDCDEATFKQAIQHLINTKFLEIHDASTVDKPVVHLASKPIATCTSEGEGEREGDKNPPTPQTGVLARSRAKSVPRETDPDWLLDFKLAYPERAGDQGWRKATKAANARMAEGHTTAEFIAGAKRYAEFCAATGKVGTEYVKQACTFLGPEKCFLQTWIPPPRQLSAVERVMQANSGGGDERVVAEQNGSGGGILEVFGADVRREVRPGLRRLGT